MYVNSNSTIACYSYVNCSDFIYCLTYTRCKSKMIKSFVISKDLFRSIDTMTERPVNGENNDDN